ncbi:MAG TPA: DUF5985 family protein [Thermoanaerobaculia bacterium]|nr:DUF5985 family protein [Thermoanaerobaculia bacterium]
MILFLSGVLTMGYLVAALFFLRFWRQTRDRLFGWFAAAFFILALHRVFVVSMPDSELGYVVRLLAFVVILAAIWDKNRATA